MPNDSNEFNIIQGLGQKAAKKIIPMFFLVDISASMEGNRIAALNTAMNTVLPELKKIQQDEKLVEIQVRVITFGNGRADWKIGTLNRGVRADLANLWIDIPSDETGGGTPTEEAVKLVKECVKDNVYREYLGSYISSPFMMLISDGQSNNPDDYKIAVEELQNTKVGRSAIMCAIGIETTEDVQAQAELKIFGRNGYRDCTDTNLLDLSKLVSSATMKTITNLVSLDQPSTPDDIFDFDDNNDNSDNDKDVF